MPPNLSVDLIEIALFRDSDENIRTSDLILGAHIGPLRLKPAECPRGTGLVAGAAAMKAMAQNSSGSEQPAAKCKIVVTGRHPGDPEYGCGGTIARLTATGHEVVLF
jgi:hypothetical protein